jgi:hypothetical protein
MEGGHDAIDAHAYLPNRSLTASELSGFILQDLQLRKSRWIVIPIEQRLRL